VQKAGHLADHLVTARGDFGRDAGGIFQIRVSSPFKERKEVNPKHKTLNIIEIGRILASP